jgi:hypothetical protein
MRFSGPRAALPAGCGAAGGAARLEIAAIRRLGCRLVRVGQDMFRRLAIVFGVIAIGLLLNGCTKCGPIWDDWLQAPKACKSDRL